MAEDVLFNEVLYTIHAYVMLPIILTLICNDNFINEKV